MDRAGVVLCSLKTTIKVISVIYSSLSSCLHPTFAKSSDKATLKNLDDASFGSTYKTVKYSSLHCNHYKLYSCSETICIVKSGIQLNFNQIKCSYIYIFGRCVLSKRHTFFHFMNSLGIKPMALDLLAPCSINWTTWLFMQVGAFLFFIV